MASSFFFLLMNIRSSLLVRILRSVCISLSSHFTPCMFFTPALDGVFYWNLNDSKSSRASRTLLSILVDPNNAVICIVSISPQMSNSSSSFSKPLGTVSSTSIVIAITVIFMFHNFLNSQGKSKYFSLYFVFFYFHSVVGCDGKVHYTASSL